MATLPSVRLTKLASTHSNLRSDTADGVSPTWPPEVGKQFILFGDGYDDKSMVRVIETSIILRVKPAMTGPDCKTYEIETMNSTYKLEEVVPS